MDQLYNEMEVVVEKLYLFRETYYKSHPTAGAEAKRKHIDEEMNKTLAKIDERIEVCEDDDEKALLLYLKGKTLNISPKFYQESEDILTKHLKLHPSHLDAWNVLGECYWKKRAIMDAKTCFGKAIELNPNSTSLRCMSMLYRSLTGTDAEIDEYMDQSLQMATKAVRLDINDGKNWYVLGNVYIAMYFKTDQAPHWMKMSLKAYMNAERHDNVKSDPDFHFNRGVAYSYDENYRAALLAFEMAIECDPNWQEPKEYLSNLLTFLKNCQESLATRGKIKARKLKNLLKNLHPKDLGRYSRGTVKTVDGVEVHVPLVKCSLATLKPGENPNLVVLGKVVCHIYAPGAVTFAFCMLEDNGPCYAVNVYNIAEGRGVKIGDSVAIPEPYVVVADFEYKDQAYKFQCIKVGDPLELIVNGKHMPTDNKAVPILKTVFNPEA